MEIDGGDVVLFHYCRGLVVQIHYTAVILRSTHVRRGERKEKFCLRLGGNQIFCDYRQLRCVDAGEARLPRDR